MRSGSRVGARVGVLARVCVGTRVGTRVGVRWGGLMCVLVWFGRCVRVLVRMLVLVGARIGVCCGVLRVGVCV